MSKKVWQLQEAKNHFSEVVDLAMKRGAQTVTKHGKPAVVIVSVEEYESTRKPKKTLFQALRECPVDLAEVIPPRSKETSRTIRFD
jgi:prevent-host-death family protein